MVVLDEDFGTNLTLVEGNGGVRLSPVSVPEHAPRDWRSQCERERARADAAEARAEGLRWAEVAARSDGGSWKSRFKACRRRLSEAVEETKEARRTARDVPSLQAEVARLETLLSEAGIASAFDTAGALRKENARLRKALAASKAREGATGPWPAPPRRRTVLEPSPDQKETVRSLRTELRRLDKEVVRRDKENARLNTRLDQEKERTERIRETAKKLSSESLRLHREVRILGDSEARARSLSDEVFWLRHALEVSRAGKEKLKARLAKLRAAGAMLSKLPSDEAAQLRAALRRSRRQKTTIEALRKGNARLRRTVRELETRKAALAVQPAKLRAIRKALESELAGLRAVRKTLSKSLSVADADLRRALRRSRRQKATIKSLSRENARLRKGAKTSRNRIETLEVQLERLRATGAVLSRALYGRKSEQQDKPGSEHKRGQQRGAAGQVRLTDWCQGWIERIASIYRLNEARLAHYDPVIKRQTPAFDAAQGALKEALDGLFAEAARELAGLPDQARQGRALRSLLNHREGLSVFVDRPQVPLDNNRAERLLRGPAIGRRLSFGSDSEDGARFTAIMYSVVGTLSMNGIDILSWLDTWLAACAENDRKPPDDLSPWLPWSMSEERRRELMAPA